MVRAMNLLNQLDKTTSPSLLYEQDILLWVEDTVAKLRAQDFESLDLENLIEEVESLGIFQRKELVSRLTRLLEHLLKRMYVNSPQDDNGWECTIVWERIIGNQRSELGILLDHAPSLQSRWTTSFVMLGNGLWLKSGRNIRRSNFPKFGPLPKT
jgi:hypothetical protein